MGDAKRADRPVHGDDAADQLAALRRHRGEILLRLQRVRGAVAGGVAEPGHLPDSGLRHGRGLRRRDHADHPTPVHVRPDGHRIACHIPIEQLERMYPVFRQVGPEASAA